MYSLHVSQAKVLNLPGRKVKILVGNEKLSSKYMTVGITEVPPLKEMIPHTHRGEEEIIIVMQGYGKAKVGDSVEKLQPNTAVIFPKGKSHKIINESNKIMKFIFCFSPCYNFEKL